MKIETGRQVLFILLESTPIASFLTASNRSETTHMTWKTIDY